MGADDLTEYKDIFSVEMNKETDEIEVGLNSKNPNSPVYIGFRNSDFRYSMTPDEAEWVIKSLNEAVSICRAYNK